jgi:hypothetical protein
MKKSPLVDYHWGPTTMSFWSNDYVSDLIAPNDSSIRELVSLGNRRMRRFMGMSYWDLD